MKNLTGEVFGRITVISLNHKDEKRREYWWNCVCECGIEKEIKGDSLKNGTTRSCGCLKNDISRDRWLKPKGEGSQNQIISNYKQKARKRNLAFLLSTSQALDIMSRECYYCGERPSNIKVSLYDSGDFVYNGIDRVDSSKGYTLENTVPCCKMCNRCKSDLKKDEFIEWVNKIYKFQNK